MHLKLCKRYRCTVNVVIGCAPGPANPVRKVLEFCRSLSVDRGGRGHKVIYAPGGPLLSSPTSYYILYVYKHVIIIRCPPLSSC